MGIEWKVTFPVEAPSWADVAALLARHGMPVQMRMIDNELVFPDATPPAGWREIRVAAAGSMVTLRRGTGEVRVIAWGNADVAQQQLWHALAWGFARAGGGLIQGEEGAIDADTFAARGGFPGRSTGSSGPVS